MIITVLRKPLEKSVEFNTLNHGCGAINIDAIRIAYEKGGSLATNPSLRGSVKGGNGGYIIATETSSREMTPHKNGRWPANFILTHLDGCLSQDEDWACAEGCPVQELDRQSGERPCGKSNGNALVGEQGEGIPFRRGVLYPRNDNGGASRFFKQFKKEEPNEP